MLHSIASWNRVYSEELNNFEDSGNVGEPWYGEKSETRIVKWMRDNKVDSTSRIVDMGCGNASLLINLVSVNAIRTFILQ